MADLFKPIKKKVNSTITHFIISGFFLCIIGLMIAWTDFLLRILVGAAVISIAVMFFYGAYRIYSLKHDIEKYFKL